MASMRLDKYLTGAQAGSRESVKKAVRAGLVTVNGETMTDPSHHVEETDEITFRGERVAYEPFGYLMMNKPKNVLTAVTDGKHRVVSDLLKKADRHLMPVGRLDLDTEGLLLFTNDGVTAHRLLSPKSGVPKKYFLATDGPFPEGAREQLAEPIVFSDFTSKGADLEILSETEAYLTVTEGKYHEVRRLIHTLGIDVISLKRVSFGNLSLGDLGTGETRRLTADEITSLKEMIQ